MRTFTKINGRRGRFWRRPAHGSIVPACLVLASVASAGFSQGANGNPSLSSPHPASLAVRLQLAADLNMGTLGPLIPELRTAPAPDWLKPGLRLVYAGGSANIPQRWVRPPHRSLVDALGAASPGRLAANAGGGMTVYDVLAVDGGSVLMTASTYSQVGGQGAAPRFASKILIHGAPGAAADVWINPTLLNKFKGHGDTISAYRQPYQFNGRSVPCIWIKINSPQGYELHVYDQATGLLVHYGADYAQNNGPWLSDATLVEQRVVETPWLAHYTPPATVNAANYRYSGSINTTVANSQPFRQPLTVTLEPSNHGTHWMEFNLTSSQSLGVGMQPTITKNQVAYGPGAFLNVWLPPEDLAKLTDGQVLDRDPVLQTSVTVSRRTLPNGDPLVVLSQSGPSNFEYSYDPQTGLAVTQVRTDQTGLGKVQAMMQLEH